MGYSTGLRPLRGRCPKTTSKKENNDVTKGRLIPT